MDFNSLRKYSTKGIKNLNDSITCRASDCGKTHPEGEVPSVSQRASWVPLQYPMNMNELLLPLPGFVEPSESHQLAPSRIVATDARVRRQARGSWEAVTDLRCWHAPSTNTRLVYVNEKKMDWVFS